MHLEPIKMGALREREEKWARVNLATREIGRMNENMGREMVPN